MKKIIHIVSKINNLSTSASIIIAGLIIASSIVASNLLTKQRVPTPSPSNAQGQPVAQQAAPNVDIKDVVIKGEPFIGNPNAPITVAYWFDYQCPFCKRFDQDAIRQLNTEYVQTGKVKIVFKDFQFLGDDSQTAGIVGRAVWEVAPNKYFAWHEAMFTKQDNENGGWGNKKDILALTRTILGGDTDKVASLVTSKQTEYQKALDDNKVEGGKFGINGTPGTIIGNQLISGAQPYSTVKQAIDKELSK